MASCKPTSITYLSGAIVPEAQDRQTDFGVLITPLMGNVPRPLGIHAHDNGVYTEWLTGGKIPFDLVKFLRHLDLFRGMRHLCLFATAPDVIGDWRATLERSRPVLPEIRKRGYLAALVAQDGLEDNVDEIPWDDFDVLFLGGGRDEKYLSPTNRVRVKDRLTGELKWVGEWKLTPGAARLAAEARARGKDVHMGRVNSFKRLSYAQSIGCTSADGTKIAYGPDIHTPTVQGWVRDANCGEVGHNLTSCFVCRWKMHAFANGYRQPFWKVYANAKRYALQQEQHPHKPTESREEWVKRLTRPKIVRLETPTGTRWTLSQPARRPLEKAA